jgi:hypothetical protein
VRRGKSRAALRLTIGRVGALAIRALPDLCLGIVLGCLEPHQVSVGFSGCYALEAPARRGFLLLLWDRSPRRSAGMARAGPVGGEGLSLRQPQARSQSEMGPQSRRHLAFRKYPR